MASVLIKRDSYLLGRGHFLNPKSDSEPEMKKERKERTGGLLMSSGIMYRACDLYTPCSHRPVLCYSVNLFDRGESGELFLNSCV